MFTFSPPVGVYHNLGLSVLDPGRSGADTAHTYDVDYLIAYEAGRGRLARLPPPGAGKLLTGLLDRSRPATDWKDRRRVVATVPTRRQRSFSDLKSWPELREFRSTPT